MQYRFLNFKLEVWEIGIPVLLPLISIAIWLKPHLKILTFAWQPEKRIFIFYGIAFCAIAVPSILCQKYLTAFDGRLEKINRFDEIADHPDAHYYTINDFNVVNEFYGKNKIISYSSGRFSKKQLILDSYFVFPMIGENDFKSLADYKYWYGIKFRKVISGNLSEAGQKLRMSQFETECLNRLRDYAFHNLQYFVKLPNSDERDNYLEAVRNATNLVTTDIIILEPMHEQFKNRTGNKFVWIFLSYLILSTVFVLLLFWQGIILSNHKCE